MESETRDCFRRGFVCTKVLERFVFPIAATPPACSLAGMANQLRKPKSRTHARYTWRPEVAVTWAVIRLNEDGSETNLGSQKYKDVAMRWAAMMDQAAQADLGKRPTKKGRLQRLLTQPDPPVELDNTVKPPDQQIAFPWNLFSRRSA
jgi:hypothetical protein